MLLGLYSPGDFFPDLQVIRGVWQPASETAPRDPASWVWAPNRPLPHCTRVGVCEQQHQSDSASLLRSGQTHMVASVLLTLCPSGSFTQGDASCRVERHAKEGPTWQGYGVLSQQPHAGFLAPVKPWQPWLKSRPKPKDRSLARPILPICSQTSVPQKLSGNKKK